MTPDTSIERTYFMSDPLQFPCLHTGSASRRGIKLISSLFLLVSCTAFTVHAFGQSLCDKNQEIIFSCKAKRGKIVSICSTRISTDSEFWQYRFGKINRTELVHPSKYTHGTESPFHISSTINYSPADRAEISFDIGKHSYLVYNTAIKDEGHYKSSSAGVMVWKKTWNRGWMDIACVIDDEFVAIRGFRDKD